MDSSYSHISALIFSNTATFSKVRILSDDPRISLVSYARYNDYGTQLIENVEFKTKYREDLLDGIIIFHNPYADKPLKNNKLHNSIIAHSTVDIEAGEDQSFIPHGFLYQRFIYTFTKDNTMPPRDMILGVKEAMEKAIKDNKNKFPIYRK